MLSFLLALAPCADDLLVCSFQPAAVQSFDATTAAPLTTLGPGSPLAGTLGAAVGPDGLVYVASEATDEILRFEPSSGAFVDAFIRDDPMTPVDETGGLAAPSGVAFGLDGLLYVGSFTGDSVLRYDGRTGAFVGVFVTPASGVLNGPDSGMTFGPDGDLYVPSFFNHTVKRYDGATGAFVTNAFVGAGSGLRNPRTVLFTDAGSALVTSEGTDQVLRFDAASGTFTGVFIGDDPNTPGIDESGGLDAPTGIVRLANGEYRVASLGTNEVKAYAADGTFLADAVTSGASGVSFPVHLVTRPTTDPGCAAAPNSVGAGATIVARGSTSVGADDLRLEVAYAPPQTLAVLFQGAAAAPGMVGDGILCVGPPLFRRGLGTTDATGRLELPVDLASAPVPAAVIAAGSTWSFQVAYRDTGGASALQVNFTPSLGARFDP